MRSTRSIRVLVTAVAITLPLALVSQVCQAQQKNLLPTDVAQMQPFDAKMKGQAKLEGNGDNPYPWSANLWDGDSTGEIELSADPNGAKAIALRNLEGKASIQFYTWQPIVELPAGHEYTVSAEYSTKGAGALILSGDNVEKTTLDLSGTGGAWKTVQSVLKQTAAGKLNLNFQNYAMGRDNALLVRGIRVVQSGEVPKASTQNASTASPVVRNETSALPDLKASDVTHPHVRPIVAEVANLHPKLVLMGGNPDEALPKFSPVSVEGRADFSVVDVEGMPFKKAWRIDTERKPQEWQTFIQSFTKEPIRSGDVLYLTAWTRLIRRTDGQAFGAGRLYATQHREGNDKDASPLGQQDFSIPQEWTRIHIPLESTKDLGAENIMKLMFTFGFAGQTVEFGGLTVINMGPGVSKESLPHPKLHLDYKGRDSKAAWRKAAAERIEKHRKGDLRVLVVDANGKPLPNATVKVDMKRHAFYFGSSFPGSMLPKEYQDIKPWNADFQRTAGASPEDKKKIQETFLRLFNATTSAPTWGTWGGNDVRISQSDLLGIMRWFAEHNIPNFNLQAVYPSPEFTAPAAHKEFFETKKKAEFAQALKEYVTLAATKFPGIKSLQIANEIEGRPQYTDLLGRESVPDWFKWVKQANPKMATEINGPYSLDGRPLQTQNRGAEWPGKDTEGLQYYYDLISWLLKQGAPIDHIGFQNHSGIGAAGPEAVLKSLNDFSSFGKPLEVTEFEVTIQNPNDAEQRQYQADYLRDYFTAVFSHPQVHMIMLQDFWQPAAWQYEGASGMFNKDWSINPHGKAYEELVLNQWWTRANGKANTKGEYSTRAFKGDHQISVTANGKTVTVPAKVGDKASVVTVKVG